VGLSFSLTISKFNIDSWLLTRPGTEGVSTGEVVVIVRETLS
jgi:hypothetical protein